MKTSLSIVTLLLVSSVAAYSIPTRRSAITMRKGRPSLKKTIKGSSGMGPSQKSMGEPSKSWFPVKGMSSMNDLPKADNEVKLVETMVRNTSYLTRHLINICLISFVQASQLIDPRTNPNGAVGVVSFEGQNYCFSAACPCCKIPMTKAKVLSPTDETGNDPRLSCDFCATTYNIKTGDIVTDATSAGVVGSVVKGLFSASSKKPLPVYALGEKSGQVLIALY